MDVGGDWRSSLQPSSEILLKEVKQHDLVVLTGLGAADAVPLVRIDLKTKLFG